MSVIEGVGDEVTALFGVMLAALIMALAWISTGVGDLPIIRVIVLDPRRWRQMIQRLRTEPPSDSTNSTGSDVITNATTAEHEPVSVNNESTTALPESVSVSNNATTAQHEAASVTNKTTTAEHESVSMTNEATTEHSPESDPLLVSQPAVINETQPERNSDNSDSNVTEAIPPQVDSPSEADTPQEVNEPIPDGHIRVRVKYLDERQKLLVADPNTTIGEFKRQNFSTEMSEDFAVRFIYRGQELSADDRTLRTCNITDNCVIHCLLSRRRPSLPTTPTGNHDNQPDVGVLMLPLFGLILVMIWYCRIMYRAYFSAISTLALIGITFLFSLALYASCRRPAQTHEHSD